VPFLEGPALQPASTIVFPADDLGRDGTLFEHCARALDHSLAVGRHGLPLIGTGDWNDGMNRVGAAGGARASGSAGSSRDAEAFAPLAEARGEQRRGPRLARARRRRCGIARAEGWDGDWYLRGYFDDGTPLGVGGQRTNAASTRSRSPGA
jgi:cyclic beta-1,2-glucan synthetase